MQLSAKDLLARIDEELKAVREQLVAEPGLALVWVGEDPATAAFVRAKQKKAKELTCQFFLHQLPSADNRQLRALIEGLSGKKNVHGIVLQLPLPSGNNADELISLISPAKDVDGLTLNSIYPPPTPTGIVSLLEFNHINPAQLSTVIIGAGRLVGGPLAKLWQQKGWQMTHLKTAKEFNPTVIKKHDLVISCTGQAGLITPAMVHENMIVIDGSGVDVVVPTIEPMVQAVTPTRGAIGPLTVSYLFRNLLQAVKSIGS